MAEEEQVGVVFEDLNASDFSIPFATLKKFMQEDKSSLQARCRAAAIKHRGIQNSVEVLEKMIQEVY
jgi:hypothetical protein